MLKIGELARAIDDFDNAVRADSKDAVSLYNRGVAKQRQGSPTAGDIDIAAARAIDPKVGN